VFLSNNLAVVIWGRKMTVPVSTGSMKDGLSKYFAIYMKQMVG
jgi:hypothetical protein